MRELVGQNARNALGGILRLRGDEDAVGRRESTGAGAGAVPGEALDGRADVNANRHRERPVLALLDGRHRGRQGGSDLLRHASAPGS